MKHLITGLLVIACYGCVVLAANQEEATQAWNERVGDYEEY